MRVRTHLREQKQQSLLVVPMQSLVGVPAQQKGPAFATLGSTSAHSFIGGLDFGVPRLPESSALRQACKSHLALLSLTSKTSRPLPPVGSGTHSEGRGFSGPVLERPALCRVIDPRRLGPDRSRSRPRPWAQYYSFPSTTTVTLRSVARCYWRPSPCLGLTCGQLPRTYGNAHDTLSGGKTRGSKTQPSNVFPTRLKRKMWPLTHIQERMKENAPTR